MENINAEYEKLYYGFPAVLLSFYDKNNEPGCLVSNSVFVLGNMLVLGLAKTSSAAESIKFSNSFCVNIPEKELLREFENSSPDSSFDVNRFYSQNFLYTKSDTINAPLMDICKVSIECEVLSSHEDQNYIIIISNIKSKNISRDLLHNDGSFMGRILDSL